MSTNTIMKLHNTIFVLAFTAICIFSILPSCNRRQGAQNAANEEIKEQQDTIYPLGFCTDSFRVEEGIVGNGEIFTGLMSRLGMGATESMKLISAIDSVFDPRKMRADRKWQAYFPIDTVSPAKIEYLVYNDSRTELTVIKCTEPYSAIKVAKPVQHYRRYADVTITSSLWNDMKASGAPMMLIVQLEDIYAWTVDFFSLQEGDRFRAIYDEAVCDGETVGIDTVFFAMFSHGEKHFPAIRFDQRDGGNKFWNEKGESMRKAFLKAPLRFSRISSGFTYRRKHPVTGKVKPHTGVDYAAPTGTPVMSIGDGTVISKGWSGGGGNTVKIRHNSVYTTAYMHLSKYASGLKVGDRVHQGDVIGYVGSTGVSTGPHLDFRVWRSGQPINPLTMESPSAEPIKSENLPAIDSLYKTLSAELDSLSSK